MRCLLPLCGRFSVSVTAFTLYPVEPQNLALTPRLVAVSSILDAVGTLALCIVLKCRNVILYGKQHRQRHFTLRPSNGCLCRRQHGRAGVICCMCHAAKGWGPPCRTL